MTFGSLFAGVGGFDLGLERAGMSCRWQVEIDEQCRKVLAAHFPGVKQYADVKDIKRGIEKVDLICGGFPCQDISSSNPKAEGITGERSSLWTQFARIIRLVRPRFAIVENVPALLHRGMGVVLEDLAKLRMDAEWGLLSGAEVGSPHIRARLFILAYTPGERFKTHGVLQRAFGKAKAAKRQTRLWQWPSRIEPSRADDARLRCLPNSRDVRVAYGLPSRLDRYSQLGNAVMPLIPEFIGSELMEVQA